MSLRTLISDISWELGETKYGASPRHRRSLKKASAKASRKLAKLQLFSELCEAEEGEETEDTVGYMIQWLWETGARYGCDCGCGGDRLLELLQARDAGFSSLRGFRLSRQAEALEEEKEALWQDFYVRQQQILATSEALNISTKEAEALWEEVNSSP